MEALLVMVLCLPVEQIQSREAIMASRDFLFSRSEQIFSKIKRNDVEYYYYRVINNFYLNNKKETLKYIDLIENSFETEIPKRISATIPLIKNHVLLWKDDYEDLADISREMLKVQNRLKAGIDKKLQNEQIEIVKRLDKIIKNKEDEINKLKETSSSSPNNPITPLEQSRIMPENGTGQIDNKKMRAILEEWGRLTPRQQSNAMQEITRSMSTRHRELTENYFRNIGKIKK